MPRRLPVGWPASAKARSKNSKRLVTPVQAAWKVPNSSDSMAAMTNLANVSTDVGQANWFAGTGTVLPWALASSARPSRSSGRAV